MCKNAIRTAGMKQDGKGIKRVSKFCKLTYYKKETVYIDS